MIAALLIALTLLAFYIWAEKQWDRRPRLRPVDNSFIPNPANDKLIELRGTDWTELQEALNDFVTDSGETLSPEFNALIREEHEREHLILFPDDISFESFYHLINYLHYSFDPADEVQVFGFCTSERDTRFFDGRFPNQRLMFYLHPDDADGCVYFETEYNHSFRLDFAGTLTEVNSGLYHFAWRSADA